VGWGLAGFVLGVVFWHFVGFWSFVSDVVFVGREDATPAPVVRRADSRPAGAARATAPGIAPHCVKLVMSRENGDTRAERCSLGEAQLVNAGTGVRADRAAAAQSAGWTATAESTTRVVRAE
jgi:hypothetical protein